MSDDPPTPTGQLRLAALHGDGIGPEIVPVAMEAVTAAVDAEPGAPSIEWRTLPMGLAAIERHGSAMPAETIEALADVDGWLLGPHDSAAYPEPHRSARNPSGTVRKHFDLFANLRPAIAVPGPAAVCPGMDLLIVRENTQGFYADRNTHRGSGELMPTSEVAMSMAVVSRPAVERVVRVAFELAARRRGRLTVVHKANVLPLTTGMFRDVAEELAADHPDVSLDDAHVDAMAAALVRDRGELDVIVTENMMGDILSDLAAELSGSLGQAPSLNASHDRAMAQATHGSAPDIAGRGIANPMGMIGSAAMLLRWLGERGFGPVLEAAAARLDGAMASVVAAGVVTPDLGGSASTVEVGDAVVAAIGQR